MQDHVDETDYCTISAKACQGILFQDVPNSGKLRTGTLHGCAPRVVVITRDYSYELRKQNVVIVTW